ncbi:MAG TPA: hypothetical protein VEC11_07690 [Allosphingosinicella sp.]|nr:hypothetical protein [Allosphingosinicella sp.]
MSVQPVVNERLWLQMPGEVASACRVVLTGQPIMAEIRGQRTRAFPVRKISAAHEGTHLAPAAELLDAAPLSAAEQAEYAQLDRKLAGTIGDRRVLRAFFGLLHRAAIYGEASA